MNLSTNELKIFKFIIQQNKEDPKKFVASKFYAGARAIANHSLYTIIPTIPTIVSDYYWNNGIPNKYLIILHNYINKQCSISLYFRDLTKFNV